MAVAYDLVLEDRMIAREAAQRRARPFGQELAEMVRHAVGYRTRAFVTFGQPIPLADVDPESRRDLVALLHQVHDAIGLSYKVLPTALVATLIRPQMTRSELADRIDRLLPILAAQGANLSARSGREAVDDGVEWLSERGVLVLDRQRLRVRDRIVLRYYARTIQHLVDRSRKTH